MKTLTKIILSGLLAFTLFGASQASASHPVGLDSWPTWPNQTINAEHGEQPIQFSIEGKRSFIFPFFPIKSKSKSEK